VQGRRDVLPRALHEVERALRREADGVQHAVEAVDVLAQSLGQAVEVLGVRHVELEHLGRLGEPPGDRLGDLHRATERGEHDLRTLLLRDLRYVERDRAVHEDAGDEELLAFEDSHACDFLVW
jgi:hypothetical protein